jgi:hypothetical protein
VSTIAVTIESGFATVGAGRWLMAREQPAAYCGSAKQMRRKGWFVRDRSALCLVELTAPAAATPDVPAPEAWAKCASAARPFLTHIPCAAELFAVSEKVLVAPAEGWKDAKTLKPLPMSLRFAFSVTHFTADWVVMATRSRTARLALAEGETLSVRQEAAVAWTTPMPTGFCPKLSIMDVLLPRGPAMLGLTFYGPGIVWIEGAAERKRELPRRGAGYGV